MNKIAKFEKVSFEEFLKAIQKLNFNISFEEIKKMYNNINLPLRQTNGSAGYDFYSPVSFDLKNGETILIPTGIKAAINAGYVLIIVPRSSMGFKYRLQLDNTIGVIDSDYYNNEDNEGHIFIKLSCDAYKDVALHVEKGDRFAQGLFLPFGITIDDVVEKTRDGGIGSTNN